MVWKNGENGFHGVEVFRKVASMARKNGEFGFHGVEVFQNDGFSCGRRESGQILGGWSNFERRRRVR
jgi:hypothetical protein